MVRVNNLRKTLRLTKTILGGIVISCFFMLLHQASKQQSLTFTDGDNRHPLNPPTAALVSYGPKLRYHDETE